MHYVPGSARVACAIVLLMVLPGRSLSVEDAVAPYVVTTREDVQRMLDLAAVGPGDLLIDLGSGDGRLPIAAAQRGAMGIGVDIDADLVALARERAAVAGVGERAHFVRDTVFTTPITEASVVTLYLMPEVNLQLRPRLLCELQPGTRVVSNTFTMGDWAADAHVPGRTSGGLLLWVVPDRAGGRWRVDASDDVIDISQRFQQLTLSLRGQGEAGVSGQGEMRGSQLTWTGKDPEGTHYRASARVHGDALSGVLWREPSDSKAPPERRPFQASRSGSLDLGAERVFCSTGSAH